MSIRRLSSVVTTSIDERIKKIEIDLEAGNAIEKEVKGKEESEEGAPMSPSERPCDPVPPTEAPPGKRRRPGEGEGLVQENR